jgi:NTP pyrophosphatase (non-canonical NTP hydrolase)
MMTRSQFLLTKLAEECTEVAQRALKTQQFGFNEIQPGQSKNNAERLQDELIDLHVILGIMTGENIFQCDQTFESEIKKRTEKVNKYYKYSQQLGMVQSTK